MNQLYRILDANVNRISEGTRVLEDLARFNFEAAELTEELKNLRHSLRKTVKNLLPEFISQRDSNGDLGLDISQKNNLDDKKNLQALVAGNFKRIQEGLRVVEEILKVAGYYAESKIYEKLRYQAYSLEKTYFMETHLLSKKTLPDTDLYCLTSEEHSLGRSNLEVVKEMLAADIKIIQYREKDKKLLAKYDECKEIRKLTKDAGATFIINDDIELAILVKADGVHVGQDDLPVEEVRKLVGNEIMIGVSTHSRQQALAAVKNGADYIGVGPIFKTFTKKDVCDPVGFEYLEYVAKNVQLPFVAIGGIKEDNIAEVAKRGAKCIAMVTEIVGAKDIKQKINNIRAILKNKQ